MNVNVTSFYCFITVHLSTAHLAPLRNKQLSANVDMEFLKKKNPAEGYEATGFAFLAGLSCCEVMQTITLCSAQFVFC